MIIYCDDGYVSIYYTDQFVQTSQSMNASLTYTQKLNNANVNPEYLTLVQDTQIIVVSYSGADGKITNGRIYQMSTSIKIQIQNAHYYSPYLFL